MTALRAEAMSSRHVAGICVDSFVRKFRPSLAQKIGGDRMSRQIRCASIFDKSRR